MDIRVLKQTRKGFEIPETFRFALNPSTPGTAFSIFYEKTKYVITAKHLELPPKPEKAWANGMEIQVKSLRLPFSKVLYDVIAVENTGVSYEERTAAVDFPWTSDVEEGDPVVFCGFPHEQEIPIVQVTELQIREAQINSVIDFGYHRKFFLSEPSEEGFSGGPVFLNKNGLTLIGVMSGTRKFEIEDQAYGNGFACSIDRVLNEIRYSDTIINTISGQRPKRPRTRH